MKTYATNGKTPVVRSGKALPANFADGDAFYLEAEVIPVPETKIEGHKRGLYYMVDGAWKRIFTQNQQAFLVGSRVVEVEVPHKITQTPRSTDGFYIGGGSITASTITASIAITGSLMLEALANANIWVAVFRNNEFITGIVESLKSKESKTISLSFMDYPNSTDAAVYDIRIGADQAVDIKVNLPSLFGFNGKAQTAIILSENT